MRLSYFLVAITILLPCEAISQGTPPECPVKNEKTAVQFLLDHKANSLSADRHCVDQAFVRLTTAVQFQNKNYIPFLVSMLDFERFVTELEHADNTVPTYPAIEDLVFLCKLPMNVAPFLIKAIKESDSELQRKNAAQALGESGYCRALKLLARAAEKQDLRFEQRDRLETAEKQIKDWDPNELNWHCSANSQ
jgi:hypothetical protein